MKVQEDEGSCVDVALADMTTIIFRMNGGDPDTSLDLTPQIGIDRDSGIGASIQMCTKPQYGLEKNKCIPMDVIDRKLLRMFGRFGFGCLVVFIMCMGPCEDPVVACKHATKRPPYRHALDDVLSGVKHAMLIVGLNTMSENKDDHYESSLSHEEHPCQDTKRNMLI
ncbi:hypothetical protein Tco_1553371 [Tanacetum coccineum]